MAYDSTHDDAKGVTLRQLLTFDDGGILRLLLAPAGQDVPILGVVIGDEGPGRSYEGRVVLAAGLPASVAASVREAARRGAAAVVVRGGEGPAHTRPGGLGEFGGFSGLGEFGGLDKHGGLDEHGERHGHGQHHGH
ncbi:hypothetical protein HII36_12710, partial [Nonomuraea sp. NN258]|nr:hypothetical protein [Nonomuraea antri]